MLVLLIIYASQRKDLFLKPVSLFGPENCHDEVRTTLLALCYDQLLNVVRCVKVLVIARRNAVEVKQELLL